MAIYQTKNGRVVVPRNMEVIGSLRYQGKDALLTLSPGDAYHIVFNDGENTILEAVAAEDVKKYEIR